MIATLAELIAPLPEPAFRDLLRTRHLSLLNAADAKLRNGLPDADTIWQLIECGQVATADLRLTRDTLPVPSALFTSGDQPCPHRIRQLLDAGASLIVQRLDRLLPALGALCADIALRLNETTYAACIMTTGQGGAFGLHHDPQDLLILQLEGRKHWTVFGPPAPVPCSGKPQMPPELLPLFDQALEPGDLLFLPAGYWHRCRNGDGRSLHIGLFIEPPTGCHAVEGLLQVVRDDPLFRAPLTRQGEDHEAALKARLRELLERLPLSALLGRYTVDRPAGERPPSPSTSDCAPRHNG